DLVGRGDLSDEGATALLTPGETRDRLEEAIKEEVLKDAPQSLAQPLGLAQLATQRAVNEAARRISAAENEVSAMPLAGLGQGTHAHLRIAEMVEGGTLSPAAADALLSPDLEHRAELERCIEEAVRKTISRENRPLTASQVSNRVETAIDEFM